MKNTPHNKNQNKNIHDPVLLEAVLQYLNAQPGESYLDVTAGYGGHAKAIMESTLKPSLVTLVDRDSNAISYLSKHFEGLGVEIIKNDYLSASKELLSEGREFNIILADLGVSSPHLNEASRGFSFKSDGLKENIMAVINSIKANKPSSVKSGYLKTAFLAPSMGPSISIDVLSLNETTA